MKFKVSPPPRRIFGVLIILTIVLFVACKKMDSLITAPKQDANRIEEKFFNSHRTADPVENALVNFIKRKNDSLHFVEKTVKQIGYP